jgi:hypothetical protein
MVSSDDEDPIVAATNQLNESASAAPTPKRKLVSDFFKKVPTAEHIQSSDLMMAPDILDLRNVFKSGIATGDRVDNVIDMLLLNITELCRTLQSTCEDT